MASLWTRLCKMLGRESGKPQRRQSRQADESRLATALSSGWSREMLTVTYHGGALL